MKTNPLHKVITTMALGGAIILASAIADAQTVSLTSGNPKYTYAVNDGTGADPNCTLTTLAFGSGQNGYWLPGAGSGTVTYTIQVAAGFNGLNIQTAHFTYNGIGEYIHGDYTVDGGASTTLFNTAYNGTGAITPTGISSPSYNPTGNYQAFATAGVINLNPATSHTVVFTVTAVSTFGAWGEQVMKSDSTLLYDGGNPESVIINAVSVKNDFWNGNVDGTWDINGTANWKASNVAATYADGDNVVFDDSASGTTTINAATTVSPTSITVNVTNNTYIIGGGPIAGSPALTKNGTNTLTLTGTGNFGNIMINAGALTVGNPGELTAVSITDNGMLRYNSSTAQTLSAVITGGGSLELDSGTVTLGGNNTYTGTTTINGGILNLMGGSGWALNGSRAGNTIIVNSGGSLKTPYGHQFGWTGTLANITVNDGGIFNNLGNDNYIGNLILNGNASLVGSGHYIGLSGGSVSYTGTGLQAATIAMDLTLQNSSVTPVNATIAVSGTNAAGDLTVSGSIYGPSGAGLTKTGSGTLILSGANTYSGTTTISNGTLRVDGSITNSGTVDVVSGTLAGIGTITAPVNVSVNGTLSPGDGNIGALNINSNLTLAGNVPIEVNKALNPSNDVINVAGALAYGGTLTAANIGGSALVVGDAFQIFPAGGSGNFASVAGTPGSGMNWSFNPTNGVLSVVSAVVNPPVLGVSHSGNLLTFTWSGSFKLQSQTNTLGNGLGTNWFDYPNGASSGVTADINPANPTVFFRLISQ